MTEEESLHLDLKDKELKETKKSAITDDEINIDPKKFSEFLKNNKYRIIAIGMLLMAVSGMWFCWKAAWLQGATTICENSGGTPIIINSQDIKDGKCLIKYDDSRINRNNLGLTDEDIKRFEEGLKNG